MNIKKFFVCRDVCKTRRTSIIITSSPHYIIFHTQRPQYLVQGNVKNSSTKSKQGNQYGNRTASNLCVQLKKHRIFMHTKERSTRKTHTGNSRPRSAERRCPNRNTRKCQAKWLHTTHKLKSFLLQRSDTLASNSWSTEAQTTWRKKCASELRGHESKQNTSTSATSAPQAGRGLRKRQRESREEAEPIQIKLINSYKTTSIAEKIQNT